MRDNMAVDKEVNTPEKAKKVDIIKNSVLNKIRSVRQEKSREDLLPPKSNLRYFGVTFREPRSIDLIHPTTEIYTVVIAVIKSIWRPGIAEVQTGPGCHVTNIKLNGSPFWFSFSHEFALQVHYTILKVIGRLDKAGYQLILASDLARYFELSTLFFTEKPVPNDNMTTSKARYMSVTISHNNQLQLANCPLSNKLAITQLINNTWHYGINKEISLPSGYIIILNAAPWTNKKLSVAARSLLHQLVLLLNQRKWNLVTSARIKNHRDSLIFRYEEDADEEDADSDMDTYSLRGNFLSLSLSEKDKLRVIHCSDANLIKDLKNIIVEMWRPGLLAHYKKYGGYEFVLDEKPWWCVSTEAIRTRFFICDLLEQLYMKGFMIHAAIECHPDLTEKTTLTFKQGPAKEAKVICISFDERDKVRVINGSQLFVNAIRSVLANRLGTKGIQKEREFMKSVEFTLGLDVWDGKNKKDSQVGKSICCHILQKVAELGWSVVLSADATSSVKGNNNRHDIPMDVHSWYLVQTQHTYGAISKFKMAARLSTTAFSKGPAKDDRWKKPDEGTNGLAEHAEEPGEKKKDCGPEVIIDVTDEDIIMKENVTKHDNLGSLAEGQGDNKIITYSDGKETPFERESFV